MQAHLRDLALNSQNSKPFTICQRVLHRCHEIIFEDSPGLVKGPYSTIKVQSRKVLQRKRVKPHMQPAIIGMALIIAGAPGLPLLTKVAGEMSVEQGKAADDESNLRSLEPQGDIGFVPSPARATEANEDEDRDDDEQANGATQPRDDPDKIDGRVMERESDRLLYRVLSQSQKMQEAAQTTPVLSSTDSPRISASADDPFGQLDESPTSSQPFQSSPAISNSRKLRRSGSTSLVDAIMQSYDTPTQRRLLQGHYCRSEVRQPFLYSSCPCAELQL